MRQAAASLEGGTRRATATRDQAECRHLDESILRDGGAPELSVQMTLAEVATAPTEIRVCARLARIPCDIDSSAGADSHQASEPRVLRKAKRMRQERQRDDVMHENNVWVPRERVWIKEDPREVEDDVPSENQRHCVAVYEAHESGNAEAAEQRQEEEIRPAQMCVGDALRARSHSSKSDTAARASSIRHRDKTNARWVCMRTCRESHTAESMAWRTRSAGQLQEEAVYVREPFSRSPRCFARQRPSRLRLPSRPETRCSFFVSSYVFTLYLCNWRSDTVARSFARRQSPPMQLKEGRANLPREDIFVFWDFGFLALFREPDSTFAKPQTRRETSRVDKSYARGAVKWTRDVDNTQKWSADALDLTEVFTTGSAPRPLLDVYAADSDLSMKVDDPQTLTPEHSYTCEK